MKILHIISGLGDGGAEASLFKLISHDGTNAHCVVSLTNSGKYGDRLGELGVTVMACGFSQNISWINKFRKVIELIETFEPDIIQTWMYHADFVGAILGVSKKIPVVWNIRNSTIESNASLLIRILVRVNSIISSFIPFKVICCAYSAKLEHERLGYDPSKMEVIPNGFRVEDEYVPGENWRLSFKHCRPASIPILGMIARFDHYKDHTTLLTCLSELKKRRRNFFCILVGAGMDKRNPVLTNLIDYYGLEQDVVLLGSSNSVPLILKNLDLHVLSSRSEGFPNVVAEAMACGVPCVATDVGDASRIIGPTGWLVPAQDPLALAEAIDEALSERISRTWPSRRVAARQRIMEEFSIDMMVERYRIVWHAALAKTL